MKRLLVTLAVVACAVAAEAAQSPSHPPPPPGARGESRPAFDERCIPSGLRCSSPEYSRYSQLLGALPDGRIARLGATADFHHGLPGPGTPEYTIDAIRYATIRDFALSNLVIGASKDARTDIAMVVWLIRGGDRTILFDTGFHRARWMSAFKIDDFLSPDAALKLAGVDPGAVTDIVVSHAHWDHMGGIDLFPNATIWIQKAEYEYYTGAAWQPGGRKGGIDGEDIQELVRRNLAGKVRLVDGDNQEILPGLRAYTGARHTFASQYIRVGSNQPVVLASDNCYLYENLSSGRASATFERSDEASNLAAQRRMIELAGDIERVVPGHDVEQFRRYKAVGRVARIR